MRAGLAGLGALAVAGGALIGVASHGNGVATHSSPAPSTQPMRLAAAGLQNQYWMVASDGGIFSFGGAPFYGSTGNIKLVKPIVGMAATPDGGGYWFVASDGGIFTEGDAGFYGSQGATALAQPIVGMARTPSGHGYWLVARDGGIFSHGDARFFGSTGAIKLAQPIVGMAATPDGGGYWFVASDGGVFAFGDAGYLGSMGGKPLAQPIVGMAATSDGQGYWLVARDGGIFSFGSAKFYGSTGNIKLAQPIVGMAATQTGHGYWFVASDGGIFSFGDAQFSGSTGNIKLAQPVVGMAARPTLFPGSIDLSESSPSVTADGVSTMTITATVTDPGVAVPGDTLAFSVPTGGCGTLSASQRVTDLNGQASVVYTSSPTVTSSCMVSVSEVYGGLSSSAMVNQVAGAPSVMIGTPGDSSYTADQGNSGIPATFTVTDSLGNPIEGALVDFTTSLPNGSVAPTSGVTGADGSVSTTLNDVIAESGTVTGTVDGTSLNASTGTITITSGALHTLTLPSTVTTQKAGQGYDLLIGATDTYGNPINTAENITFGGSATAASPNGTVFVPSPGPVTFSGGQATVNVTSFEAQSGATLTASSGTVQSAPTNAFTINPNSAAAILAAPAGSTQRDADTMNTTGLPVTFTVSDTYGNPVSGVGVTITAPGLSHASPAVPGTLTTGDGTSGTTLGVATFTLHDTTIADTGTVTGALTSTPAVTDHTGTITITPGLLASFGWSGSPSAQGAAIPNQTAGQAFTAYLNAFDSYGNLTTASAGDVTLSGTALAASPNGTTSSHSVGAFSGGQSAVMLTSTAAGSGRTLIATDSTNTFNGTTATGNTTYTVNPATYTQLVATSPSFTTTDVGNGIFFQDPSSSDTAAITLTAEDSFGNTEPNNTDAVTVTLAHDATGSTADGGSLVKGITTSGPDTSLTNATLPVTLSGGTVTFNYNVPNSFTASSANGIITFSDTNIQNNPQPTSVPATTEVTLTKVHLVSVGVSATTLTADTAASPGLTVTGTASNGSGTQLSSVPIDFTASGLVGTNLAQSANTPSPAAAASVTMHPTTVSSGTALATLRGAPTSNLNLTSQSPTVTVTAGTFAVLTMSAPSPATPVAGAEFTATLTATDAESNPVTPGGSPTAKTGSTAFNAAPDGTSGVINSVGSYTNGQATMHATAFKAQTGATLGVTYGSVSSNTQMFDVTHGAVTSVVADTLSSCCTADTGNSGFAIGYTVEDHWQNTIASQSLQLTVPASLSHATVDTSASPSKANSVPFPVDIVTNSNGHAGATVYDTTAGDTGTVTATGSGVQGATETITIIAGSLNAFNLTSPGDQVAGAAYTMTVTAVDKYGNAVQPSVTAGSPCPATSATITCAGTARDTAPDTTQAIVTFETAFNSLGQATLQITSFKAEANVSLTVADGSVTKTSSTWTVAPAAATQYIVTSSNSDYSSSTHTATLSSGNETVGFTITMVDPWQNIATTNQADQIDVSLQGSDDGSLAGGGQTTAADSPSSPVVVHITLSAGTGSFLYKGPALVVPVNTGTISFADTTSASITPTPTTVTVKG